MHQRYNLMELLLSFPRWRKTHPMTDAAWPVCLSHKHAKVRVSSLELSWPSFKESH
jgi:hypothetical protein